LHPHQVQCVAEDEKGGEMKGRELLPFIKSSGRGDKFSENLVKWVKKYRDINIFAAFSAHNNIDGSELEYLPEKSLPRQILIGHVDMEDGWLHGSRLSTILCQGARSDVFAYSPGFLITPLPGWWDGYINGGKCFIDPEHKLYTDKERWQLEGDMPQCLWCGNYRKTKHVEMCKCVVWK
jgi:hypothetical protein